jgi:hypothetical protein
MKNSLILIFAATFLQVSAFAKEELKFTVVKENPITSIKDQNRSGTCWCFTGTSFLESEAIRINSIKDTTKYPDFSEMFTVSKSYQDRADKYIRMDGNMSFSAGSECEDVLHIVKEYGIVPQTVQPGLNYGTLLPVHGELDATTLAYVQAINKKPNKTLSTAWKKGFTGIINAYLGECPETFQYEGKTWTPASYRDYYKINPDDYVSLTSFTHHPFYSRFALEVCDNWRADRAYNVPLDELINALFYAIEHGYTATWGGDVSEEGFSRTGYVRLTDHKKNSSHGSDKERWVGKGKDNKEEVNTLPVEEEVTQESRQKDFDIKSTTDDHGMHAFGIAKDQYGNKYIMVKNSWGKTGKYKGIWYLSEAYTKAKVLDIIVHKDALPKSLKKKLGIK